MNGDWGGMDLKLKRFAANLAQRNIFKLFRSCMRVTCLQVCVICVCVICLQVGSILSASLFTVTIKQQTQCW